MPSLFVYFFLFSSWLHAGTEVSNGADARVCNTSQHGEEAYTQQTVELAEFSERRINQSAHTRSSWTPAIKAHMKELGYEPFEKTMSFIDIRRVLFSWLEHFKRIQPERATAYQTALSDFPSKVQWVKDAEMDEVDDEMWDLIEVPNCELKQLIVQKTLFQGAELPQTRYFFNEDLWKKLPNLDRSGALLHEIIYKELIALGYVRALTTSLFNLYLVTTDWRKVTSAEERPQLLESHFNYLTLFGMPYMQWGKWSLCLGPYSLLPRSKVCRYTFYDYEHKTGQRKLTWSLHQVLSDLEGRDIIHATLKNGSVHFGRYEWDISHHIVHIDKRGQLHRVFFPPEATGERRLKELRGCLAFAQFRPNGNFDWCPQTIDQLKKWLSKNAKKFDIKWSEEFS